MLIGGAGIRTDPDDFGHFFSDGRGLRTDPDSSSQFQPLFRLLMGSGEVEGDLLRSQKVSCKYLISRIYISIDVE